MTGVRRSATAELATLALASAAMIAYQLTLMQVLSNSLWYHFAYMIISVGLLGFGASGAVLALSREYLIQRRRTLIPVCLFLSAAAMVAAVRLSNSPRFFFDPFLFFSDYSRSWRLVVTYLLYLIPFFFGALPIGLILVARSETIGAAYCANLIGSAIGGLGVLAVLNAVAPPLVPVVVAAAPLAAGLVHAIFSGSRWKSLTVSFGVLTAVGLAAAFATTPSLNMSQFKGLRKTLDLPEAEVIREARDPRGFVRVVASPVLRDAPPLSLAQPRSIPIVKAIFVNGDGYGAIVPWDGGSGKTLLDFSTAALPYAVKPSPRDVAVMGVAGGAGVIQAVTRGAPRVVGNEPHPEVLDMMTGSFADEVSDVFARPGVEVKALDDRTFLHQLDANSLDVAVVPPINAFGGNSGLLAMGERYDLTVEAFQAIWRALRKDGVMSVTTWIDYPPRTPFKLLATLVEVAVREGVDAPETHLAAVRSWGTITFLLQKSPLTEADRGRVRRFREEMRFDPVFASSGAPADGVRHHQLQDELLLKGLGKIRSSGRGRFLEDYDFNIRPATDDRPYFFQFLKLSSIPRLRELFGGRSIPFIEIGYVVVLVTFFQIIVVSVILILLPPLRLKAGGAGKCWCPLYFGGIGLGYMFVEITLIQRFILYLGHPVFSAAAVISFMLLFTGVGSYVSDRRTPRNRTVATLLAAVAGILVVYAFGLRAALSLSLDAPAMVKFVVTACAIGPLAFLQGLAFPHGVRQLSAVNLSLIPWAWGVNGCASVISAALATILAVQCGFHWVLLAAALAYVVAGVLAARGVGTASSGH